MIAYCSWALGIGQFYRSGTQEERPFEHETLYRTHLSPLRQDRSCQSGMVGNGERNGVDSCFSLESRYFAAMPRRPCGKTGGYLFHVLNRGMGRATIFEKVGDYPAFENCISDWLHTRPGSSAGPRGPSQGTQ